METKIVKLHENCLDAERPAVIEDLFDGEGGFIYNHNVTEVNVETGENGEQTIVAEATETSVVMYQYDRLVMTAPKTQNHILSVLLSEKYPTDVEQKLVNDYNASKEKILPTTAKQGYINFLNSRAAIKQMVETDCANLPNE